MDRDIPRKHVRKGEDRELLKNTEVLSKVKKKKKSILWALPYRIKREANFMPEAEEKKFCV